MTTSCTHMVRGRAWSMNLGNPVDNAPYRLDRVALDHDLSRRRPPLPPPRLPTHVRRQAQPLPPGCGHSTRLPTHVPIRQADDFELAAVQQSVCLARLDSPVTQLSAWVRSY